MVTLATILPIGPNDWANAAAIHMDHYPDRDRDANSLRRKFNALVKVKKPTGDPTCPHPVKRAKHIMRSIEARADSGVGV